jgi:hypothetical protein
MTHNTQHTPGPWHVGEGRASIIVYASDGYAIANAATYHPKERDLEANARLIAAAPELLEAARSVAAYFSHPKFVEACDNAEMIAPGKSLALTLAAIAKAKGESQ